jgi:ABC-2 type transport system ATP-binding protein
MMYEDAVRRTNSGGVAAYNVTKRYGEVWALAGVDLAIAQGRVLGLLGHNGAGKTTMLRILTTLTRPTSGRAEVAGHDVVAEPAAVRRAIGVAGQEATVDGLLTARANLEMIGRLSQLPATAARHRAIELLERVSLADKADVLVKTFSGGMRRRLDLAASLVAEPAVLFLDEPTTGLDPHARNELWALLREYVKRGATLVITTQYLEEADRLADEIVVLDRGRVAASGTPAALKSRFGSERIVLHIASRDRLPAAERALDPFLDAPATHEADTARLVASVRTGTRLVDVVRALDGAGVDVHDVHRRDATLDDVFLALTTKTATP